MCRSGDKIFTTCTDYAYNLKMWDNGRVEKVLGKAVVFSRCFHCKNKEKLANNLPRGLTGLTVPRKGTTLTDAFAARAHTSRAGARSSRLGAWSRAGPRLRGRGRRGREAAWEAAPYWRRPRCIVINRAGFVVFSLLG